MRKVLVVKTRVINGDKVKIEMVDESNQQKQTSIS